MKNRMMIFSAAGMLAIASLAFGFTTNNNSCPLEGTPECPIVNCPMAGTPDCPYELETAELSACCKK